MRIPASLATLTFSGVKASEYTRRSTVLHTLGGNQPDGLALSAKDTVLPVVPMFHVNAWGVLYIAAMSGCKLVLPGPGLDGDSLVKLIQCACQSRAWGGDVQAGKSNALVAKGRPTGYGPPGLFTQESREFLGVESKSAQI